MPSLLEMAQKQRRVFGDVWQQENRVLHRFLLIGRRNGQNNGLQGKNLLRRRRKQNQLLARLWRGIFGMCFVNFYWLSSKIKNNQHGVLCKLLLSDDIKKKRQHLENKKMFHQDNAPDHTSVIGMAKMDELKIELLLLTPYSLHFVPSNYFLSPNLKKVLWEKICQYWRCRICS